MKLCFTSFSAVRMLPRWNYFLPAFQQLECFPPWNVFFTSISSIRMLPPWNCFLPVFQQLECFSLEIVFLPAFQQLECFPLEIVFFTSFSAVWMLPPSSCFLHKHFSSWNASPLILFSTSISANKTVPFEIVFTNISAVRMLSPSSCTDMCKNACVNTIYIYIIPMGYIEYTIDNFGLKNISRNR